MLSVDDVEANRRRGTRDLWLGRHHATRVAVVELVASGLGWKIADKQAMRDFWRMPSWFKICSGV